MKCFVIFVLTGVLAGCASKPTIPYSTDFDPITELPTARGGIQDGRTRFREIYCAALEDHGRDLPDYMPCDEALTRVGTEPLSTGKGVNLAFSDSDFLMLVVPGLGWECFEAWLDHDDSGSIHAATHGYEAIQIKVDGLSGTENNARQIRDFILNLPQDQANKPLILLGYSKGAPDLLEFVVKNPEIASRVVAIISASGAIGGTPLAVDAKQSQANLLTHFPKSECGEGDGGAVESMRPDVRKKWLTENTLPEHIRYYSVVTYPDPKERMSFGLKSSYRAVSKTDARNDSQIIFYDQVIPGSTLVAFTNADHWAMAVPIARGHKIVGNTVVNRNNYPREMFFESLLRFVEEDLEN
jgi:hypothetical protein